tara:strand:+ start:639 stop:836 length:198 start_codon:yes stop_codon:yes gene_type:complete
MAREARPTDDQIEAMLERASMEHHNITDGGFVNTLGAEARHADGVLAALGWVLGYEEHGALFGDE